MKTSKIIVVQSSHPDEPRVDPRGDKSGSGVGDGDACDHSPRDDVDPHEKLIEKTPKPVFLLQGQHESSGTAATWRGSAAAT